MSAKIIRVIAPGRNRGKKINALLALARQLTEAQAEIDRLRERQDNLENLNNPWVYWPAGDQS